MNWDKMVECRMTSTCKFPEDGCPHEGPHEAMVVLLLDIDGEDTWRRVLCTVERPCPVIGGARCACELVDTRGNRGTHE